jgi:peptide/nickel transport system substrate-binding protein
MRREIAFFVVGLLILPMLSEGGAQILPNVPRDELLIVDALHGRIAIADFNGWKPGISMGNGLHQMLLDTLYYQNTATGETIYSLAESDPVYNNDYTNLSIKLREGIHWSDGVEFTAEDVVYTVKLQMETLGFTNTEPFRTYVKEVYSTDKHTVFFELKESNPRFHNFFNVMVWSACMIMPKHIFEKIDNPLSYNFNPPVSLTPYILKDYDRAGYWWLFERRNDWQRTSVGKLYGEPEPRYVLFIYYGSDERKVMAQTQHQLDYIFDLTPEAWEVLRKDNSYSKVWYDDFPWAWMDDTNARAIYFNLEKYPYNVTDVRWALTLAMNVEEVISSAFGGIERLAPFGCPTTIFTQQYLLPMKPWLEDLSLKDGYKPFDSKVSQRIYERYKSAYNITESPESIWGIGWWRYDTVEAEKLLKGAGFTKRSNQWYLPNGKRWNMSIMAPASFEIDAQRIAFAIADQWRKFGIEVRVDTAESGPMYSRLPVGDFDAVSQWGQGAAATGSKDIWPWYQNLHKRYAVPTGQVAAAGNWMRWRNDNVSRALDEMSKLRPDDPEVYELGKSVFEEIVREMPFITVVINKKFTAHDSYYWENFPTVDNPYMDPVFWWATFKFILPFLEPTGRK